MVYDSRKDKYQKAKSLIPLLRTTVSTPEGLTFEALEKLLVPATSDTDSYFVNISDGEPMFGYFTKSGSPVKNQNAYSGEQAYEHTRKRVEEIRSRGIGVLSYFVSNSSRTTGKEADAFRKMYGKDARFIAINDIAQLSATMNKKFLEKE